jgi:hypothetical protein
MSYMDVDCLLIATVQVSAVYEELEGRVGGFASDDNATSR